MSDIYHQSENELNAMTQRAEAAEKQSLAHLETIRNIRDLWATDLERLSTLYVWSQDKKHIGCDHENKKCEAQEIPTPLFYMGNRIRGFWDGFDTAFNIKHTRLNDSFFNKDHITLSEQP